MRFPIVLFIALMISPFLSKGQQTEASVDLGFVDRFHNRLVDTYLVNENDNIWTLLRWESPSTLDVRVSSKSVSPSDTLFIRMKLNPTDKGPYNEEIQLLFADRIFTYRVKANIRHVDLSDHTPCPDFEKGSTTSNSWSAGFKVVDRLSKAPVQGAEIIIRGRKGKQWTLNSDKEGEAEVQPDIDYYDMDVKAAGYASYHLETYINRHQNSFIIELMKGAGSMVSRRPGSGVDLSEPVSQIKEEKKPEEETIAVAEETLEEPLSVESPVLSEFDASLYRLNNITFLIDVSTSMRQGHKMEVLRTALSELVQMLRPDDRVSLITYASRTEVLQSGISGADKEELDDLIKNLRAEGLTAGEAGLKKAYAISKRYFIESGNNQVYLITDGALSKGYEKVNAMASQQAEKDIKLSVIAISANKWAEKQMGTLAVSGRGVFLSVDSEEAAAQELKESIKQQSRLSP